MTLGERLRQARLGRNMSLSALARVSGLSKGFLSQVESGATNPSLGSLHRLARALSLSASDLMSDDVTIAPLGRTTRPQLVRRVQPEQDRSSLKQIGSSSHAAVYVAHLLPGSNLDGAPANNDGEAYLMVLSGAMDFQQPGTSLSLNEGDSLTFALSKHYKLSVRPRQAASFLLIVPDASQLPRVVDRAFEEVVRRPVGSARAQAEFHGPLRLVAMRAARAAEQGR